MRVQTTAVQFKADQKLILFIEKKLAKLNQLYDRIIEAHVTLKLENTGKIKDKIAEIRIKVPGNTLIVKNSTKSFEAAVDKAISVLKRQLKKYKERRYEV